MALAPRPTDRATFVGMTGSGKTTLARALCGLKPFVVAYDAKGMLSWPGYAVLTSLDSLRAADPVQVPRIIYRPSLDENDNPEAADAFFRWIYEREWTCCYVDEIYSVATASRYPRYLHACLTRGRERNVTLYAATQRPSRCPSIIFSEAENLYIFTLQLPGDRERIEDATGIPRREIARLPVHYFMYARQGRSPRGPFTLNLKR